MAPLPSRPANIHTLLSALRSPIFHTAHNPTAVRTGAKYLKRRLVGPSAIQYYPRMTSLSTLNAEVPWNPYGGWKGEGEGWKDAVIDAASGGQKEKYAAKAVKNEEGGEEGGVRWANQGLMLGRNKVVEPGFMEVERIRGAGWLDDAKERTRREEVALSREMGRGPPKKGQGKRSQMKKK